MARKTPRNDEQVKIDREIVKSARIVCALPRRDAVGIPLGDSQAVCGPRSCSRTGKSDQRGQAESERPNTPDHEVNPESARLTKQSPKIDHRGFFFAGTGFRHYYWFNPRNACYCCIVNT